MKIKITFFLLFLVIKSFAIDFNEIVSSYQADKSALQRKYPNAFSDIYFERFTKFYLDAKKQLESIPFNALNKDQKVDYVLMRNQIDKSIYFHDLDFKAFNEVKFVALKAQAIYEFNEKRKGGVNPKSDKLAADFNLVEKDIKFQLSELKTIKQFDSWQKAELAADIIKSLAKSTNLRFLLILLGMLSLIALSVLSYEIYRNYKKTNLLNIDVEIESDKMPSNMDYNLIDEARRITDDEIGIKDI